MALNPTQRRAADFTGKNVLVFASAGGGKTTVLVERLLKRIVVDRVPLSQIVAMTFTDAAAQNMKKRLDAALTKALEEHPEDEFLKTQKETVSSAHISTIHSFCLDLIKQYYYMLPIPKAMTNNILDEGTKAIYLNQAAEAVLLRQPDCQNLMETFTSSLFSVEPLCEVVLNIVNRASGNVDPEEWIYSHRQKPITHFEDLPVEVQNYYLDKLKADLMLIQLDIERMSQLETIHKDGLLAKIAEFKTLRTISNYSEFFLKTLEVVSTIPQKNNDSDEYKLMRKEYGKKCEKFAKNLMSESYLVKYHNQAVDSSNRLLDCALETINEYQKIKYDNLTMDFDDFEHFAYRILTNNDGLIAKKLKNHYKEIMVDEFQDTNDTQYAIVSLIANNDLFIVGDVKQSIYRFRNAKPAIMQSLKSHPDFEKIHIKENYRSKANIIEFNNELFSQLMSLVNPEDYSEDDNQTPGVPQQSVDCQKNEMFLLNNEDKTKRADLLVYKVCEYYHQGLAFKDMCVLVRTHDEKKEIKEAFERCNIPYFIEDKDGYFNSYALEILLAMMKLVLNKEDMIARCAVLTGIYGYSDEDLVNDPAMNCPELENDLEALKLLASTNQINRLVAEMLKLNHFYEEKLNDQEKDNINLFLMQMDSFKVNNLYELITYIEATKKDQKTASTSVSEEANVVKVMTIHHSKGLQFDTVFLYSNHQYQQKETTNTVVTDPELGVGLVSVVDAHYKFGTHTILRNAIVAKDNVEDLLEFERLLYVATTRSVRKLVILDAMDLDKLTVDPKDSSLVYSRKGFTGMIYSLMKNSKNLMIHKLDSIPEFEICPALTESKVKSYIHKTYDVKEIEEVAPSSLEEHEITLNFDSYKGREYGTRVHHLFESLDFAKEITLDSINQIDASISEKIKQSVLTFANSEIISKAKQGTIEQEFSFYVQNEESLIHGYMDFVSFLNDEIILIDYKTDANVDENTLIQRYQNQIHLYKKILNEQYKAKKVVAYLYSTTLQKFIEI